MRNFVSLLILSVFTSCTSYYYPTFQYIPTHSKSNEIQGTYFSSRKNEGLLLSYSFNKKFGFFTNLNTFANYDLSKGAHFSDLGLFYFKNINVPNNDNIKMVLSLSSAYGYGEYNRDHKFYDLRINRVFLQPSFFFTKRLPDLGILANLGVSYRFSYVNYNLDINDKDYNFHNEVLDLEKSPFYFGETHFLMGFGYKCIQLNYHLILLNKFSKAEISYDPMTLYFSLSINYNLDKIFKK